MKLSDAIEKASRNAYVVRSPNTARNYKYGMDLFESSITGGKTGATEEVAELNIEHFIEYPAWLAEKGYSKKSIGVYVSGSKFLFEWLIVNNLISPPDYAQTLRFQMAYKNVLKRREDRFVRFPKKGEAEQMLKAVEIMEEPSPRLERNIALINLFYYTGCRNNELAQLRIKDIDLDDCSAIVIGKGNKERKVFFNERTSKFLEKYWKTRGSYNPNAPAFCRHDKGVGNKVKPLTPTSIRNIVNNVSAIAGIDKGQFTPHYFRHAFAIKMLRQSKNLALVQDLLGHASPNSTRVYAKIYPDELQNAHREAFENDD